MTVDYYYNVGGFIFSVSLPQGVDAGSLLPSFKPFCCEAVQPEQCLFRITAQEHPQVPSVLDGDLLDESVNDLGYTSLFAVSDGYRVEIRHTSRAAIHHLQADSRFTSAVATVFWEDCHAGSVLCSMIRIVYSQAVLLHGAISIHASVVSHSGYAYLFMGKSGTGKSTHAALWMKYIPDTELLNDDNPVVRIQDGTVWVYGTPWSGKTPCYKNQGFPVGGMVRLRQAAATAFLPRQDIDAFVLLLPGCSAIRQDKILYGALCSTLVQLAEKVPVALLYCRPDQEAATLCFTMLANKKIDD